MAFNQIQFQHGMSIPEFLQCFGTEAQCAEAVKQSRWPDGFRCPRCDSADHCVLGEDARRLFQCYGCRHQASLTAGSVRVSGAAKPKVAVKYHNAATGDNWTGRGLQPRWLKAALAAGAKVTDFAV